MKKFILIIITSSFLLSCRQEYKRTVYYPSGKVKSETIYASEKEMELRQNYSAIYYYENGNIEAKKTVRNGMLEGDAWMFYENGGVDEFHMYQHDTRHGIYKKYDTDGKQIFEALYLNGARALHADIEYENDTFYYQYYMYINDSLIFPYGYRTYDKNREIIGELSHACEVIGKDTIDKEKPYDIEIRLHTQHSKEEFQLKVLYAEFGDFNYKFEVIDSTSITIVNADNDKIFYSFYPKQAGYNFLTGNLFTRYTHLESNNTFSEIYPVYKLFYVKEK